MEGMKQSDYEETVTAMVDMMDNINARYLVILITFCENLTVAMEVVMAKKVYAHQASESL